tara:strand:+ start:31896 stop:32564 length:669 start_codon:yes stop_codon:yes gene_type:complete
MQMVTKAKKTDFGDTPLAELAPGHSRPGPGESAVPVTVSSSRTVHKHRAPEFDRWLRDVAKDMRGIRGYLGMHVIKPATRDRLQYVVTVRFATCADWLQWENSRARHLWLERARGLFEGEPLIEKSAGLEYWFTLPELPERRLPSRHKMAVVVYLAALVVVNGLLPILQEGLAGWPGPLRGLLIPAAFVALMTYAVIAVLTRLFSFWLFDTNDLDSGSNSGK